MTPAAIIALVARGFGLEAWMLTGREKYPEIVIARKVAYLMFRDRGASFETIARRFDRDRTTIMHGVKTLTEQAARNFDIAVKIEKTRFLIARKSA